MQLASAPPSLRSQDLMRRESLSKPPCSMAKYAAGSVSKTPCMFHMIPSCLEDKVALSYFKNVVSGAAQNHGLGAAQRSGMLLF